MDFEIPKRYRLAGIEHRVKEVRNLAANDSNRGDASHFDREARIDSGLCAQEKRRVLFHEALHHMDDIFNTKLTERQVKCISTGVAELVRQLQPEVRRKGGKK